MKTKSIEWWNSLKKNEDTDVIAIEGDNVVYVRGIVFRIWGKKEFNKVEWWKV